MGATGKLHEDCGPSGGQPCGFYQPIRFPGQWDDGVDGVWYNWHRMYLPEYGIYSTRDPMQLTPVSYQPSRNRFAYALSAPMLMRDPTGLDVLICQRRTEPRFMAEVLQWLFGNESVDTYHTYAWDTRQDAGWGMQGSGATGTNTAAKHGPEEGPATDLCWPVDGSGGHEDEIMQSVYEETYWREKWPWLPLINDCHGAVRSGVEDAGFEYPEGPFRVFPGGDDDTNDDGGNRPYHRVYELMP